MTLPAIPSAKDLSREAARAARRSAALGRALPRGAAALTRRGRIYAAPELSSKHGAGTSAERAVLYRARLDRAGPIVCILLRGGRSGRSDAGPPSAASLQVILELAPRALLYWGTERRPCGGRTARQLLPGAFDRAHLTST